MHFSSIFYLTVFASSALAFGGGGGSGGGRGGYGGSAAGGASSGGSGMVSGSGGFGGSRKDFRGSGGDGYDDGDDSDGGDDDDSGSYGGGSDGDGFGRGGGGGMGGGWGGRGGYDGGWWNTQNSGNFGPNTTTYAGTGTITVPQISATAKLVSATATMNSASTITAAQIVLQAVGNGPGICAQGQSDATFSDASSGRTYQLKCGYDIPNMGTIANYNGISWSQCLSACGKNNQCQGVVYSRALWVCWLKNISNLQNPLLGNNTDRYFAYQPSALRSPFTTYVASWTDSMLKGWTPPPTTTTVMPVSGTFQITATTTATLVAVNATAAIANGTTLAINMLWHLGGR